MEEKTLYCSRSILQVIGCILRDPTLLDDGNRPLSKEDFESDVFYMIVFAAIYNLYSKGCAVIDEFAIDSFLSSYPTQYQIYEANHGNEYVLESRNMCEPENYDYYYHRLRKFTLLRYYESKGFNTSSIYDSTITNPERAGVERQKFDALTEQEIIDTVENTLVILPRIRYSSDGLAEEIQAGDGLDELIDSFMEQPDMGIPLSSVAMNSVTRGARLQKLYMRSCPSGGGKTRLAAGDACSFSIPWYWDDKKKEWHYTGISEPTLYITTEQSNAEIQTLFQSYVACVNEEHIIQGKYEPGELERVRQANQYIKSSPLYLSNIPDFAVEDIANIIKKYKREKGVRYICFDYIHSSMRLMAEMANSTGKGLREDQVLLYFADKLKTLCMQLDVFVLTASQLNGEYMNATVKDQNLLRGAKSLADKLDIGCIAMPPSKTELEKVKPFLSKQINMPTPNMCTWIYKCRRGRLAKVILWQYVDLGTCRTRDLFVTTNSYEVINVDFTALESVEKVIEEHSISATEIKDTREGLDEAQKRMFDF